MDPAILEPIMAVAAMLGIGTFVLIGMKMRFDHKARMLGQSKDAEEVERLVDAMDSMYEQTRALREEIGELQERIDFHERMLTRPKNGEEQ
jgi:hypothetical protein